MKPLRGTDEALRQLVHRRFGKDAALEPLPGDASDRRYVRVRPPSGPTRILMRMREPLDPPYLPFERMASFLRDQGFPVPEVLGRDAPAHALVLQDLGDLSLQEHLLGGGEAARQGLYEEAVDWIVRLQRRGTPAVTPDLPAYHACLDDIRFGRELQYFDEHYVHGLLGDPLPASGNRALRRSLELLAAEAGRSGDRVLCHRDFHSRNLMLPPGGNGRGGRLVMIDFQDARLGPRAYDLASLLCDAYVDVPPDLRAAMRDRFVLGAGLGDRTAAFDEHYAWVATQRSLKAVGTFAGQRTRFGRDLYLPYIPRALAHAEAAMAAIPALEELRSLLPALRMR